MDEEVETLYIRQLNDLRIENEKLRADLKQHESLLMVLRKILDLDEVKAL